MRNLESKGLKVLYIDLFIQPTKNTPFVYVLKSFWLILQAFLKIKLIIQGHCFHGFVLGAPSTMSSKHPPSQIHWASWLCWSFFSHNLSTVLKTEKTRDFGVGIFFHIFCGNTEKMQWLNTQKNSPTFFWDLGWCFFFEIDHRPCFWKSTFLSDTSMGRISVPYATKHEEEETKRFRWPSRRRGLAYRNFGPNGLGYANRPVGRRMLTKCDWMEAIF